MFRRAACVDLEDHLVDSHHDWEVNVQNSCGYNKNRRKKENTKF